MTKEIDGKKVKLIIQPCKKCAFRNKEGKCMTNNIECFEFGNYRKSWKEIRNEQ